MTEANFRRWLEAYRQAWETRDAEAAQALFAADALYYWTPFEDPKRGRQGIADAWSGAVTNQRDVAVTMDVLAVVGDQGIAHWTSRFERIATGARVKLDGIAVCDFDALGLCTRFREWWHAEEHVTG
jgi:ketosteroid isomerase-like protein